MIGGPAEVQPKRNFIKENVQRLKDAQQPQRNSTVTPNSRGGVGKNTSTASQPTAATKSNNKPKPSDNSIKVIKAAPNQFDQGDNSSTALINFNYFEPAATEVVAPSELLSTRRDMCSQTGDVTDEMFLKDVIIRLVHSNNNKKRFQELILISIRSYKRIPSAQILDDIKTGRLRSEQSVSKKRKLKYPLHEMRMKIPDDIAEEKEDIVPEIKRANHITRLQEFLLTKSVSKANRIKSPAELLVGDMELSNAEEALVLSFQRRSEIRKEANKANRRWQRLNAMKDDEVFSVEQH